MRNSTVRIRRPSLKDAQAVCALVPACVTDDLGAPDIVLDDVLAMWSGSDLDLNVWAVDAEDYALMGYALLEVDGDEMRLSEGCVLPAARGRVGG
ncbi:GNAT family acetyltransferase, partial [Paenibacillus riograndensis]